MTNKILEICVDSHQGLLAAVAGGADRIELCSALSLGGLTPSESLLRAAACCPIPVYVMIRPRAGDFNFDEAELSAMEYEIDRVKALGLAGVVLGVGGENGLNFSALEKLSLKAEGLGRTLHRVIDLLPNPLAVLPTIANLGFERILTSGGAQNALSGIATIKAMVAAAPKGLSIMAGSGITRSNAAYIQSEGNLSEIHSSASQDSDQNDKRLVELGFAPSVSRITDVGTVKALREILNQSS